MFDGNLIHLANSINTFFCGVSDDLNSLDESIIPAQSEVIPDEFIIEPFEVERKLAAVNSYKSSGPDDVPNWILHDFSRWLAEPVCAIFNASIREGIVPKLWKCANVVPLPKVSPPISIESDLRPISLTPTLSKILESFIGGWIFDEVGAKIDKRQFGAMRGRSTTHALLDILLHHRQQALKDQLKALGLINDCFVNKCNINIIMYSCGA